MTKTLIKEFLKRIALFSDLEDTQLDAVCAKGQVKHYKAKSILFDEYNIREHLREITGLDIVLAENLVEATQDAGAF